MGRTTAIRGTMAAVLLAAATAAGMGLPVGAHASGSGCTSGQWTVMSSPSRPGNSTLYAALALSPTDVWVGGGTSLNSSDPLHTAGGDLFEHWDGSTWSVVRGAGVGDATVEALAGVSSNDVWGFGGVQGAGGLTEHWDGHGWHLVPNPAVPADGLITGAVALGRNDVWATGSETGSPIPSSFTEHWDGHLWTSVANFGGAIAASSDTDVWVATGNQTLHQDGSGWTVVDPAANAGGGSVTLNAIAATASGSQFASGYATVGSTDLPEIQSTSAGAWSEVSLGSAPSGNSVFESISAASASDVWTVGIDVPSPGAPSPIAEHWDGTAWTSVTPLAPGGVVDEMYGVSALPGQAWAVGTTWNDSGEQPLIETYCA